MLYSRGITGFRSEMKPLISCYLQLMHPWDEEEMKVLTSLPWFRDYDPQSCFIQLVLVFSPGSHESHAEQREHESSVSEHDARSRLQLTGVKIRPDASSQLHYTAETALPEQYCSASGEVKTCSVVCVCNIRWDVTPRSSSEWWHFLAWQQVFTLFNTPGRNSSSAFRLARQSVDSHEEQLHKFVTT